MNFKLTKPGVEGYWETAENEERSLGTTYTANLKTDDGSMVMCPLGFSSDNLGDILNYLEGTGFAVVPDLGEKVWEYAFHYSSFKDTSDDIMAAFGHKFDGFYMVTGERMYAGQREIYHKLYYHSVGDCMAGFLMIAQELTDKFGQAETNVTRKKVDRVVLRAE